MKRSAKFLSSALVSLIPVCASFGFQRVALPGISLYRLGVRAALKEAGRRTSAASNLNRVSKASVAEPFIDAWPQNSLRAQFGDLTLIGGVDFSKSQPWGPLSAMPDSRAWRAAIGLNKANWEASIGFTQVDPLYGYDPTGLDSSLVPRDVHGPSAAFNFKLGDTLHLSVGGEWFSGMGKPLSISSSAVGPYSYGLSPDDRVTRYSAELAYRPIRNLGVSVGMQAIDWSFKGRSELSADGLKASERWYSFGLGYNLSSSASLRFLWQVSDFGQGFSFFGTDPNSKAPTNLIRTQLTIKF